MNKITVLGLKEERSQLLTSLMKLGVVEITQEEPGEDIGDKAHNINVQAELNEIDSNMSVISRALDILNSHVPVKKPIFSARIVISEKEYSEVMNNRNKVIDSPTD